MKQFRISRGDRTIFAVTYRDLTPDEKKAVDQSMQESMIGCSISMMLVFAVIMYAGLHALGVM